MTLHRAETDPTRRVARQMAPCGVAGLDKVNTLPASRALLGAICRATRMWLKREQTLD